MNEDQLILDDKDKATLFNEYFTSVHTVDNNFFPFFNVNNNPRHTLNNIFVTPSMVISAVKKLNNKYSCGIDGIPNVFYKKCFSVLVTPLCIIFNESIKQNVVLICG